MIRMPRKDDDLPALPHVSAIVRIVESARKRAKIAEQLKEAILRGDREREHALAREYCGLPPEPLKPL
jgi:hypothetical protein